MRTRTNRGCYSSHNTPGDGSGFSKLPEKAGRETADVTPQSGSETGNGPHLSEMRHAPVRATKGDD